MRRSAVLLALFGSAAAQCPFAAARGANQGDHARAQKSRPGAGLLGDDAAAIRKMLNKQLTSGPLALPRPRPCEEFSLEELHKLQRELACGADAALTAQYAKTDGRAPRYADAAALAADHATERADAAEYEEIDAAARVARCHEIAMSWTHHLNHATREALRADPSRSMPLLPVLGAEDHGPKLQSKGHTAAASRLESSVTCTIGHAANKTARGTWEGFPHWPYEVTYNASGYGPYPFWTGGPGGGSSGKLSGPGVDIQTWWSAVQNAERLDHASCSLAGVGYKDGTPCTHLFIDNGLAYLFSQDQKFCCQSGETTASKQHCRLTRPQRDFMDVFEYKGEIDYKSEDGLYNGKAKKYTMHLTFPPNFYFWYATDMNDKPLEQGEGPCEMFSESGDRNCFGGPKMLFHQYHPDSFKEATIEPSVFNVPDVCKQTTNKCLFPNFCSGRPGPR